MCECADVCPTNAEANELMRFCLSRERERERERETERERERERESERASERARERERWFPDSD